MKCDNINKWCKYSNKTDQIDESNWEKCLKNILFEEQIYHNEKTKTVFFSSYNLPGRIHRSFRKSTLYISGFPNSEQFDSICLDYAYQLVESVVSHCKYEDNM